MLLHICILFYRCIEISSDDETAEKFPNKGFVKHNLEWTLDTLEQSPILAKGQWYVH